MDGGTTTPSGLSKSTERRQERQGRRPEVPEFGRGVPQDTTGDLPTPKLFLTPVPDTASGSVVSGLIGAETTKRSTG